MSQQRRAAVINPEFNVVLRKDNHFQIGVTGVVITDVHLSIIPLRAGFVPGNVCSLLRFVNEVAGIGFKIADIADCCLHADGFAHKARLRHNCASRAFLSVIPKEIDFKVRRVGFRLDDDIFRLSCGDLGMVVPADIPADIQRQGERRVSVVFHRYGEIFTFRRPIFDGQNGIKAFPVRRPGNMRFFPCPFHRIAGRRLHIFYLQRLFQSRKFDRSKFHSPYAFKRSHIYTIKKEIQRIQPAHLGKIGHQRIFARLFVIIEVGNQIVLHLQDYLVGIDGKPKPLRAAASARKLELRHQRVIRGRPIFHLYGQEIPAHVFIVGRLYFAAERAARQSEFTRCAPGIGSVRRIKEICRQQLESSLRFV